MEGLLQAKKLIEEAQNILILTTENPGVDNLGSALSLSYTLNNVGKIVNFFPKRIPQSYLPLFPKKAVPESFVISVRGKEISELYYEKENQILKIFLTSRDNGIKKEDVRFNSLEESSPYNSDLLITIGVERLERLGEFYEKNFKLFYQTPILNIDNHRLNNEFGNVNLVNQDMPTAVIANKIVNSFGRGLADKNIKTWLLAGAMEFSQRKNIGKKHLQDIFALSSPDLPYDKIVEFFGEIKNSPQANLLAAVLRKIEVEKGLPYACLSRKDFESSNADPKDLGAVLKNLKENILRFPSFLLLWESDTPCSFVRGVFYSSEADEVSGILSCFGGDVRGRGLIFSAKENNMNKVKEKILKAL